MAQNLGRIKGTMWYMGTANTDGEIKTELNGVQVYPNDMYFNGKSGCVFAFNDDVWTERGSLRGAKGDTGTIKMINATLPFVRWSEAKYQTLTVEGLNPEDFNTYTPLVPDSGSTAGNIQTSNFDEFTDCEITAVFESVNSVTFKCSKVPAKDIDILIKTEVVSND